jgi:AraC-like DNA-binding protein
MKAISHKIDLPSHKAFEIRKDTLPHFHNSWHFHEEIELTLILKSTGRRFIGDHIDQFTVGDLVLIGSNLPHLWQNETSYYETELDSNLKAEAIIIHFSKSFWESQFLELEEIENIKTLLKKSKYGIKIGNTIKALVTKKIEKLLELKGFDRLILCLDILNTIASEKDPMLLASPGFINSFRKENDKRLDYVYEYIMEHFTNKIELSEVAKLIHLSNSAFCRFFKSKTRTTFSYFVNQARIGYACKLLQSNDLSISQICYECGFESYTYFSRTFKQFTKITPTAYRKNYNFSGD